jgi:hypothetical protein
VFNVIAFSFFGWAAGIHSNIPFPLLCLLAMFPAAGLVPWLMLRIGHPHGALVLGAIIVGGVKIFGCVVARIVYGPDYIALGYVSADWSTAKLMISFMWSGTVVVSIISGRSAFKELMQRRSS